jgi:hypothetical protein
MTQENPIFIEPETTTPVNPEKPVIQVEKVKKLANVIKDLEAAKEVTRETPDMEFVV